MIFPPRSPMDELRPAEDTDVIIGESGQRDKLREELKGGMFMFWENYIQDPGVWADPERVGREHWQNMFDANNFTLDGIEYEIKHDDDGHTLVIRGDAEYSFRRLLHFGGGKKADPDRSAGGKHDATKIVPLVMLRDLGFTELEFGSQDWALQYSLEIPDSKYIDEENKGLRGLHATLYDLHEKMQGNYMKCKTSRPEVIDAFLKARDFFRHSENADFKKPDIETEAGGIRFLGIDHSGNYYQNGQRIHYDNKNVWETLPNLIAWSNRTPFFNGRKIVLDRDRSLVTSREFTETFVPFVVESMSHEELIVFFEKLAPIYPSGLGTGGREAKKFLELIAEKLAVSGYRHHFPDGYLADDVSESNGRTLKQFGYTLCERYLARLGMPSAADNLKEIEAINEVEPNELARKRMQLLMDFVEQIRSETVGKAERIIQEMQKFGILPADLPKTMHHDFEVLPIKLFAGSHPMLGGQYALTFVWLKKDVFSSDNPMIAWEMYKHELAHRAGPDQSADFTYYYTIISRRFDEFCAEREENVLREFRDKWRAIETPPLWQHPHELEDTLQPMRGRFGQRFRSEYHKEVRRIEATAFDIKKLIARKNNAFSCEAFAQLYDEVQQHPQVTAYRQLEQELRGMDLSVPKSLSTEERQSLEANIRQMEADEKDIWGQLRAIEKRVQRKSKEKWQKAYVSEGYYKLQKKYNALKERLNTMRHQLYGRASSSVDSKLTEQARMFGRMERGIMLDETVDLYHLQNFSDYAASAARVFAEHSILSQDAWNTDEMTKEIDRFMQFVRQNSEYEDMEFRVVYLTLEYILSELKKLPAPGDDDVEEQKKRILAFAQGMFDRL